MVGIDRPSVGLVLLIDPLRDIVYVATFANSGQATVSIVSDSTYSVIGSLPLLWEGEYGCAYDSNHRLFYFLVSPDSIVAINASSDRTLAEGHLATVAGGMTFDPLNGFLYVTSGYQDTGIVSVFEYQQ
jgi:DNA-binding beta-propeller fold protein YncE